MAGCPFCSVSSDRILAQNQHALAIRDAYPVSKGHTLVIPRRHVPSLFELTAEEQRDIWKMIEAARRILIEEHRPDGFNIGINEGAAAGQTVGHTHIHIIPRYSGDVPDPRGGVRWIIPAKAVYWSGER